VHQQFVLKCQALETLVEILRNLRLFYEEVNKSDFSD